ncbi:MAG: heme exporter protein CcmD [Gammaproteobacteria bacterium]
MTLTEFLHMGGYAGYVWSSYGIALVVLVINVLLPAWQRKKLLADIARTARRARRKA